ncbi:hypothetical protein MMSR116_05990 [Methylobacterium mesophilicum SR1.6/6]|uniref:Histidine kinase n=1 Tax=Methylobacterium mesophilicum SR1.6/6 TaxID=908290 RepID=A0A6B9FK41_9HYPH|nr:hypothetical protein [Methylobacterium mesophilicum]QGY01504.1 hypothetical protein MMSR116_05990 [Methylobacterium mesophilicum SR1.6/6]
MLDPIGHAPIHATSPTIVSVLRAEASARSEAQATAVSVERARADIALTVALSKVAGLQEAKARYTADTTDDACRLMMAAQEAAQAMLSAFVSFRERLAAA